MNRSQSAAAVEPVHHQRSSLRFALVFAVLAFVRPLSAQSVTGTIEGRVFNPANGENLERARLTIDGTAFETFTDADGNYRLSGIPAGTAKVRVFYTGLPAQTADLNVAPGQTAQHDFPLSAASSRPETDRGIVKLSEFVVGATKEMDGMAIAINEQRFAPNIKNVISSDEFGGVAEGNVAEVLKYLPGVTVDTSGGNARFVSINGVASDNVPVTLDGFNIASVAAADTGRSVQIDMMSINNLSRIEVTYSPTPETPGAALAGSVNMVPRSSFERSRAVFNGSAYLMMRDNARDFRKVPGARTEPTRNVYPGFDFTYVAPVNKRFGYTVSGGHSAQYSAQDIVTNTWRGAGSATNGGVFPNTTPDKPYLSTITVLDAPKETHRDAIGATLDYKLTPNDRISFSVQWTAFQVYFKNNTVVYNVNRVLPTDFTLTSVHGFAGAGEIQLTRAERNRFNRTYMPTLTWRHDGPVWRAAGGLGFSHARDQNLGGDRGFFRNSTSRRTAVTVSFDDIFYLRPRQISVTDGVTGAPVDPFNIANYVVNSGNNNQDSTNDTERSAYANLRREFKAGLPFTLKGGLDVRQSIRDLRGSNPTFTFVGQDGRATTAPAGSDDSAVPFFDASMSQRIQPFGFPRTDGVSNVRLWDFFKSNPASFVVDENSVYRSQISASKHAEEVVSAAYLRGDVAFFNRRLKLIGGVRAEQTNDQAEGPLTDPTRNLQHDANGKLVLVNGRPVALLPATDVVGVSKLTFVDRGSRSEKEYLRYFPSLNASFDLRENLIARAALYSSIGRPDFNQYSGGITLPDTSTPPSQANRITVNNAGIKPWNAQTASLRLEYYFEGVGQISVGGFRRDFHDAFGGSVFTPTPEFLTLYGLDAATFGAYDVSTQANVPGVVRMSGVDVNYKQVLTFLPHWARGLQVFANGSAQRATGPNLGSFSGSAYVPRSASWGFSLAREKYNLRMNWNYRGRQRKGVVGAGLSIEPETYNWTAKRLYVDVLGEYRLSRKISVFANLRNIGGTPEDFKIIGPHTPAVAQFRQRADYGGLWMFGLKGSF